MDPDRNAVRTSASRNAQGQQRATRNLTRPAGTPGGFFLRAQTSLSLRERAGVREFQPSAIDIFPRKNRWHDRPCRFRWVYKYRNLLSLLKRPRSIRFRQCHAGLIVLSFVSIFVVDSATVAHEPDASQPANHWHATSKQRIDAL